MFRQKKDSGNDRKAASRAFTILERKGQVWHATNKPIVGAHMIHSSVLLLSFPSYFSPLRWIVILAAFFVAVGCIGELVLVFQKAPSEEAALKIFEKKKRSRERVCVCLVALGISVELLALPLELREAASFNAEASESRKMAALANERAANVEKDAALSNERAGTANRIVKQADERAALVEKEAALASELAGLANKLAGEANERAAVLELNNLVLRSNIAAMELEIQPRTITTVQKAQIVDFLGTNQDGRTIAIRVETRDPEVVIFASKVSETLTAAGFNAPVFGFVHDSGVWAAKFGLSVHINQDQHPACADKILNAFKRAGVTINTYADANLGKNDIDLFVGWKPIFSTPLKDNPIAKKELMP